jgi:hypothetical protein
LQRCTGESRQTIEQALDYFLFQGSERDELWAHPLITISRDLLAPVLFPLRAPNLVRSLELWAQQGGLDLEVRGDAFEESVRLQIGRAAANSKKLRDVDVLPGALVLGDQKEEIDFVARVGRTVLMGEAKCQLFPTAAFELHNYYRRLEGAASQIQRKVDYARLNQDELKAVLWEGEAAPKEPLEIIPVIITNLQLGVGMNIGGVPVADLLVLRRFLRDGVHERFVVVAPDGATHAGEQVVLYTSDEEAQAALAEYLATPPQLDTAKSLLRLTTVPLLSFDRAAYAVHYEVQPPPLTSPGKGGG